MFLIAVVSFVTLIFSLTVLLENEIIERAIIQTENFHLCYKRVEWFKPYSLDKKYEVC